MAVFTPVTIEDAAAFLSRYALGDVEALEPIAEGVENTNYRLTAGGHTYVLTLYEKRVRAQDLPFYLDLTAHLADRGYPAPRPMAACDGAVISALNGRPAAIIAWKPGRWKRDPDRADFATAGAALAQLHAAAADYPATLENRFSVAGWRELLARCAAAPADRLAAAGRAALVEALAAELDTLAEAWPEPEAAPRGTIHGDYFPDNILFTDDKITGVIDFYFACTDFLAYDLAIALNAWCFDAHGVFRSDAAQAFSRGYESVRPLNAAERRAMPVLCRGAAVRFTLSRLHDVLHHDESWLVTPKDPAPFFARLVVHRDADAARLYGLAP